MRHGVNRDQHLPLADELAVVFARMSGLLISRETVETSLRLVSSLALDTVPGAVGAGVTLVDARGHKRSSGSTDDRVEQADDLQYQLGEGPCLTAVATRQLVRLDDVATDPRWPRWSRAVAPLGLHAALSAPLVAEDESLGALKVYAEDAGTFDGHGERLISMFAAQAAVLVANVQSYERAQRLSDDLRRVMDSRDLVSMAKGMLMAREGVDEATAFDMLIARAGQNGATLHDAARSLVDSAVRRRRS
jgi:GAF domain-containing protein